jgi:hypothetical protein
MMILSKGREDVKMLHCKTKMATTTTTISLVHTVQREKPKIVATTT